MRGNFARRKETLVTIAFCVLLVRPTRGDITTFGDLSPSYPIDAPDPWIVGGNLDVGGPGDGAIHVVNGGQVSNTNGYIGYGLNSTGTATVDGNGSTWTNSDNLYVGTFGTGALNIMGGGRVINDYGEVAGFGIGTVTVSGTGSTWTNSRELFVSYSGTGTLNITDGGLVNVNSYTLVGGNGGQGSVNFDNGTLTTGALLAAAHQLHGTGTVNAHGLVTDIELFFDQSHGLQQQVMLNISPNQNITTNLDVDGSGFLGAGYGGQGSLMIADGLAVSSTKGYVGYLSESSGVVTVLGTSSTWTNGDFLYVGHYGTGTLNIIDGGKLNTGSIAVVRSTYLGYSSGSTGVVTVDGPASTWTNKNHVFVGYSGIGTLTITGGGNVNNSSGSVGNNSGSSGTVIVEGTGSVWTNRSVLDVGYQGAGILRVTGGGKVSSGTGYLGHNSNSTGAATVDGTDSVWTNVGFLYVGDSGTGTLNITNGGTVDIGSTLRVGNNSSGNGTINLIDGVLRLHGGLLTKGAGAATFNFAGGRLEGAGTINLGSPIVQNGGILAPGNSAGTTTIQGGYTFNRGALEFEISGTGTAGVAWDLVNVTGAVNLLGSNGLGDGVLNLVLKFAPSLGGSFLVLGNDGIDAIIGTFVSGSTVKAPFNGNLYEFAINYTAGTGNDVALLTQAVSVLGDYNGNGVVDAADYTIWRDSLGKSIAGFFGADGDGSGIVDAGDYDVWKSNFGHTSGSGSDSTTNANTAVPEPTPLVLAIATAALAALGFRLRKPCYH